MSVLVELQARIENTNALISQYERTVAEADDTPLRSLLVNIKSLEKLKRRLEAEFIEVAADQELEVYRYRILNDQERVTLGGVADAWARFQGFFSSVYSALTKTPGAKKKPPQSERGLELGYGYSFASSIGVVVTVPREVGIYAATPIEQASETIFDLIEERRVNEIALSLGPEPIQKFHDWIGTHLESHSGLGLEWRSARSIKRSVEVQFQELSRLQKRIAETTTTTRLEVIGELFAVNDKTKEFQIRADDGKEYVGEFTSAITPEHAASVPARYRAAISQITKFVATGEKQETKLVLDRIDPL